MKYLLAIYGDESAQESMPPEAFEANMKEWFDYDEQIRSSLNVLSGSALEPSSRSRSRAPSFGYVGARIPLPGLTEATERVFREEYGRVFATLVRIFGDFDVAEEAI